MVDDVFIHNIFIWCSSRRIRDIIRKMLDILIHNYDFSIKYPIIRVHHLSKLGSDHNLLMVNCCDNQYQVIKYFKFLNFCSKHNEFLPLVKDIWERKIQGNHMWILYQK